MSRKGSGEVRFGGFLGEGMASNESREPSNSNPLPRLVWSTHRFSAQERARTKLAGEKQSGVERKREELGGSYGPVRERER